MDIFVSRLEFLMIEKGLTQTQLAKSIGLSQQAVSRYLSKQRTPDIEILKKLACFFEVSADYLLGLSDGFFD